MDLEPLHLLAKKFTEHSFVIVTTSQRFLFSSTGQAEIHYSFETVQ
jgi:hypothetical protein